MGEKKDFEGDDKHGRILVCFVFTCFTGELKAERINKNSMNKYIKI